MTTNPSITIQLVIEILVKDSSSKVKKDAIRAEVGRKEIEEKEKVEIIISMEVTDMEVMEDMEDMLDMEVTVDMEVDTVNRVMVVVVTDTLDPIRIVTEDTATIKQGV